MVALAGVPGLIVAGVAAISAFVALNWAAITAGFDTVRMAISGFVEYLASIPGKIANFFTGGTGKGAPTTDDLGHDSAQFPPSRPAEGDADLVVAQRRRTDVGAVDVGKARRPASLRPRRARFQWCRALWGVTNGFEPGQAKA